MAHEQFRMTAKQVCQLMRCHRVTIRDLARKFNLTMKRVRQVRSAGAAGFSACEWHFMVTGVWPDLPVA